MGNQGSALGDGEPAAAQAAKQLVHFDHSFKSELHTSNGALFVNSFGECSFAKRTVQLTLKASTFDIMEDVLSSRKFVEVSYGEITEVGFDHASGETKFGVKRDDADNFVILTVPNSVELESELRLRLQNQKGIRQPPFSYVGMFAGATKPKPFQRKRPNLTKMQSGKLPPLAEMRRIALELHRGSYAPCPSGHSRRIDLAAQHIYDGYNTFPVTYVKGQVSLANQWRLESLLLITENMMVFKPTGVDGPSVEIAFDDIENWVTIDNEAQTKNNSGIDVFRKSGEHHYFGTPHVRDLKHTLEYFWNKYKLQVGESCIPGSTHGRPLETIHTLSGEMPAPLSIRGSSEVVDSDGTVVRPGARTGAITKRQSLTGTTQAPKAIPPINNRVRPHWNKVVVHQGWLLKKGGLGVGSHKEWIKRYFVLYETSQGHFLVYYSDLTECPLYSTENNQRNVVDMSKATFIRPGSVKGDQEDTPPHSFDIVTTEREWTLCAESQENMQRWLQLLTRGIDEDVAILPDENLEFKVKAKVDPLGVFNPVDYSTTLKVSANGVSVTTPDPPGSMNEKEICFWVYTDFYKWSLLSQNGKLALLVNVFSDGTFGKRYEFIFRTKDAVRLATAIEFFIEKFMSVMHVRLEAGVAAASGNEGVKQAAADEWQADDVNEVSSDYGGTGDVDLLDMGSISTPAPPVPSRAPPADMGGFGSDPFASSGFGSSSSGPAPPLTPEQENQHKIWLQTSILSSGGPLYDDGLVQIATKLEMRGSQGRLTLFFRNHGSSTVTNLNATVVDSAGLIRFENGTPSSSTLDPLAQAQQAIMMECMKPASPGPKLTISYDSSAGSRNVTISLPITVTSFNEPLNLNSTDFGSRWQMLVQPGQEAVEVFYPSNPINPSQVHAALGSALKFGRIKGMADESDFVIYGAATLRTGAVVPGGTDKVSIGCLIKIEMNVQANAFRITTRTIHPSATSAIMATAKELLS